MKILIYSSTVFTALMLSACAVSPATQALRAEYESTIPVCSSNESCQQKWTIARAWVVDNSDFAIRSEGETRIMATSNLISQSGLGVTVIRSSAGGDNYQFTVSVECFSAYGCPNSLETMLDFNRTLNAVQAKPAL
ncbi:MAG: hypothetical protein ACJAS2_001874 [Pseudohongiellaceae bacterium]|jgi:hypothetical protein